MTSSQQRALEELWPGYGIDCAPAALDLDKVFGRSADRVLEIGFGNGESLVEQAKAHPELDYIGIEVHEPGIGRCLNQIAARSLTNIRLICHDAIEVMQHMLADHSLDRILLFFPDPWHKKRHNKRRIVNRQFRDLCYRLLKDGGRIHLATDWQDYAEHMSAEFLADDRYLNCGNADGFSQSPQYRPETHFERRGLKLGHGVWDLLFEKLQGH